MHVYDTAAAGLAELPSHSIYGRAQRAKRGLLRLLGRWSRAHYDVEVVVKEGVAAYKKITFVTNEEAYRTDTALQRFGASPHLPRCHRRIENVIWVDFVPGSPCRHIADSMMPAIAECFTHIASRRSRLIDFIDTPYGSDHDENMTFLSNHGIADPPLLTELRRRSAACTPHALRIGFDYRDPIAPNLLQRRNSHTVCAIDVKNLHEDSLVGEGIAKASDRWLTPGRRQHVFARLRTAGLHDIERNFAYITLYERIARVRRKVERDLGTHGHVRQRRRLRQQLLRSLALPAR